MMSGRESLGDEMGKGREMTANIPGDSTTPCGSCGGASRAGVCPSCMLRTAFDADEEPAPEDTPTTIGDYELLEVIAQGGMGVVWRARQRRLRRIVALKLLRESCLPGEAPARRFRLEAEAVALLRHPHIVTVHEVGEMGGRYFFSMELLAGSLAERLLDHPYAPRAAAELMAKVAHGVQHAHDRGVLHRDLKPSNILLDEAGEPRVSDFGVARLSEEREHPTLDGAILGTPAYMSPEQATGLQAEVTTASDVYSLGAVFYEMLTGRVPFGAPSHFELLRQVAEDHPPRPSTLVPNLDRDLETICLKCLEKAPAARYPSARALARDLERWARGEPIEARPVAAIERLWKWSRRHKSKAALIATAICGLLTLTGLSLLFTSRLQRENLRTHTAERAALQRLATQHGEAAAQLVRDGDWLRALPHLVENCTLLSDDPVAARLARMRFETIVRTAPRLAHVWLPEGWLRGIDFDEDSARVAIFSGRTARVFDSATGEPVTPPLLHDDDLIHGHILERGNRLLCETNDNRWALWDARTGERFASGSGFVFPFKFAPSALDRGYIHAERFLVWEGTRVQPRFVAQGDPDGAPIDFGVGVEWALVSRVDKGSGDPLVYLIQTKDGLLHLCDPASREEIAPPIETGKNALLRGFEMNSNVYAFESDEARGLRFGLVDMASRSIVSESHSYTATHRVHGWMGSPPRWCSLVREDNGFTLREVLSGNALMFAQHSSQGFGASVSIRGKTLATASRDGALRIWQDGGTALTPFLWVGARPEYLALSPSGRQLLCGSTEPAVRLWERRERDGGGFAGEDGLDLAGAFFSENQLLLCRTEGRIERRDLTAYAPAGPELDCGHPIRTAVADARGRIVLLASAGAAELWDVEKGRRIGEAVACRSGLRSSALSSDGTAIALLSKDGECRAGTSASLAALAVSADARSVALSADGRGLLVLGSERAEIWTVPGSADLPASGARVAAIDGAADGGTFSPDGRSVILWGGPPRGGAMTARVFDAGTGLPLFDPLIHAGDLTSATFSPDCRLILTTSRDDARLWDLATGQLVRALREHALPPHAGGFSPDGAVVWTRTSKELRVWETASGTLLAPPMVVRGRGAALWSPDGRWLAGFDDKQGIRAWDLAPGARPLTEMRVLAQLLSAHRLTSEGTLYPLTREELRDAQTVLGTR